MPTTNPPLTARERWPNSDPRWPPLILELAARIAEGEDVRAMLHDACEGEGYGVPNSVLPPLLCTIGKDHTGKPASFFVRLILGVVPLPVGEHKWIARCLEGRQP